jgi:DNA-binding transcriptional MerR regulator/methylmalonyl-CoA mutase cobalamin-binding subunit
MATTPAADTESRHPIAVAARRSGLTQDVLRVWERRYGAVRPLRSAGGQRLYSDADIERLALLHAATRAGRAIGQVAELPTIALIDLVNEDRAATASLSSSQRQSDSADIVMTALDLTARLEGPALEDLFRRAMARLGIIPFIEGVAAPVLRSVGAQWHAGRLSPAHEHLVSSMLHDLVLGGMRSLARAPAHPTILVTTPVGERHVIGAALAAAAAATAGWNVLYLGGDLPAQAIADAAQAADVRMVALSVTYIEAPPRAVDELRALRSMLPERVTLIAGGAGALRLRTELAALGIRVEPSISELERVLGTEVQRSVTPRSAPAS